MFKRPTKQNDNNICDGLLFTLAVGRLVVAHTDLLALWIRLEADRAARCLIEVADSIADVGSQLEEPGLRSSQVKAFGEQVAGKNDLLSFNAAAESAGVGRYGRGPSVVGREVGKRTASTKEAVCTVRNVTAEMERPSDKATTSNRGIRSFSETYSGIVASFAESVRTSMKRMESANKAVDVITSGVQQIVATAESFTQSSQQIAEINAFDQAYSVNASHVCEVAIPVLDSLFTEDTQDTPVHILAARLHDHAEFVTAVAEKFGTGHEVVNHNECALGRWYNGEGSRQLNHLKTWPAFDGPHRRVHAAGASLVQDAKAETAKNLANASLELLSCFVKLKNEISTDAPKGKEN